MNQLTEIRYRLAEWKVDNHEFFVYSATEESALELAQTIYGKDATVKETGKFRTYE